MPLDSHESLQRLQEGDPSALNDFKGFCYSIYKKWFPSLLRDAEDLTHDIYIKIKELNKKDLAAIEYPPGWLYRVVRNHCLDEINKQKRNELCDPDELDELFDGAKRAEDYPPAADVWIEHTAEEYCKKTIRNAIERLPKELDRIIMSIDLEGKLKDKEVLEELKRLHCQGIIKKVPPSEGAIRTKRFRIRANLEKIILRETNLEEIKANLRSLELPLPVEQEIMRRIPKEIMRQIPNGPPNSAPTTTKPFVPWIIGDSIAIGFALFIGSGIGQPIAFQPSDSPNALEWVGRVEPVDAPVVKKPPSKPSQVNQARGSSGGESENENQENDPVQKTAGDSQAVEKKDIESDKGNWTQTKGPYGEAIYTLHATPEGVLFAGAEKGIFRSKDGGDTWVPASEGLRYGSILSSGRRMRLRKGLRVEGGLPPAFNVLTQKGNTLYAETGPNLSYSINGGDSWQQLTHFQDGVHFVGGATISGIAIIGDTIYIGRLIGELSRDLKWSVFFSNDDGKSWTPFDSGLSDQGPPTLFASGTTLFAQMRGRVFRRKAGENSWAKLTIKDPSKKTTIESDVTKFAVFGDMVYIATADGDLFRSTNMGDSWQSIKPQAMQEFGGELVALGNTVFYISSADGRVFRSTDAGDSWTIFNSNLTNQNLLSIAILSEKTLYVGTDNGVFRSTDGGESWKKASSGITDTTTGDLVSFKNALYTVTGDGIVKSVDGGDSWVPANDGLAVNYRMVWHTQNGIGVWTGVKLTVSGGKLYASSPSTSGVYCLAEDENSWLPIQAKIQSLNDSIDRFAVSGETFYVVAGNRVYRWRVGESLWTNLGLRVLNKGGLAVSGRTVYVATQEGKLLRSVDEGENWTDVSQHLPNWDVQSKQNYEQVSYDLHFVGGTIYAGSYYRVLRSIDDDETRYYNDFYRVFRSTDGGKTWRAIVDGLPSGWFDIKLVYGTTLYGANSHGIFRLPHESDSWEKLASMLPVYKPPIARASAITSLAFDGTAFYANTWTEGIFRLSLDE